MENRIRKLQQNMEQAGLAAALIVHHRNLFYYAGTAQPCNLLVPARGEPVLYVRRALDFVRRETHLDNLCAAPGLEPARRYLAETSPGCGRLGVELDRLPAALYLKLRETFSSFELADVSPLVAGQRAVKEPAEQEAIRQTARLYATAHAVLMERLRPGAEALEVSTAVYRALRREGAAPVNFHRRWDALSSQEGVIAGAGTAWQISGLAMTVTGVGLGKDLPWGTSRELFREGDPVVVDLAVNRGGYHADQTRTYCVGRAGELLRERFAAVAEIHRVVLEVTVPGAVAGDLYRVAEEKARALGVYEYFQGYGDTRGSYIGHGIGLEVDEDPLLAVGQREVLAEGAVVCIEPKLIVPHWGAVDLEDTVLVTAGKPEVLGPVAPILWEAGL